VNEKKMTRRLSYPYIVWMAIFVIVPLIIVCIYGLTDKTGAFTLENVKSIASPVHLKALFLSLKLSIISTVLCFVLALPLALVIRGMHLKSSGFIIFVFILPMWMNFLLRTIAWQSLLEKTGVINMILQSIGLPEFDQYRRGDHSRYDLQFSAIYGIADLQFPHQDSAGYLRCGKRSWGKLDTDIVADHIATDSSGNCQRYYDGICAGNDNICHFKPVRRSEDQSDRKCDRAGIYDGQ